MTFSPHAAALLARIQDRSAVVGVIGQGYVGLPLALVFVEAGFRAFGFDVDPEKITRLERGDSYIRHIGAERVAAARAGLHPEGGARFTPTADFDRLAECDAILICVPTPLGRHREPDLSYVLDTTREIAARLHPGQLVVLESTTYPGTTDEEVQPLLEAAGLRTGTGARATGDAGAAGPANTDTDALSPGFGAPGVRGPGAGSGVARNSGGGGGVAGVDSRNDFFLAFSPEREDPGNPHF
ncbi:MAG TPA: NAD(P)-binding domain-containing protein, partial [Thermoleophilia bacterium]|nr:NAD(P)-binding domain-containing protein [Thermoleophilia bacterium]